MKNPRRAVMMAFIAALPWGVAGQPDSGKVLRLVVGAPAGSAPDVRARWLADKLHAALGQTIIIDNQPAAAGNLAAVAVAHAPPDGNTLLLAHQGVLAINPHLFARPGYDALVDLVPVARLGIGPLVLAAGPQTATRSLPELLQLAKARPGALSYASPAIGSPPFLAAELMKHMASIDLVHVPSGPAGITQTVVGHIGFVIDNAAVLLPFIQSGRLRALAVTGRERLLSLPDVPTFAEAGVPDYVYYAWMGVAAPVGTPEATVQRLNRQISAILATEEARAWFAVQGVEPGEQSAAAFAVFVREEHAKAGQLIRQLGLRVD